MRRPITAQAASGLARRERFITRTQLLAEPRLPIPNRQTGHFQQDLRESEKQERLFGFAEAFS